MVFKMSWVCWGNNRKHKALISQYGGFLDYKIIIKHILLFSVSRILFNISKDAITLFVEKAMTPHSSTLAWKIPWMEESGRLQSMRLQRVGHDWVTSLSLFTFLHWRRKWQPTPVFLLGESHRWRSLVGCHLWGHTESTWLKWLSSSSSILYLRAL